MDLISKNICAVVSGERQLKSIKSQFVVEKKVKYHVVFVKALRELHRPTQHTSPTPTWPPTGLTKCSKKGDNHNKSVHIYKCSCVKRDLVSSVSF